MKGARTANNNIETDSLPQPTGTDDSYLERKQNLDLSCCENHFKKINHSKPPSTETKREFVCGDCAVGEVATGDPAPAVLI